MWYHLLLLSILSVLFWGFGSGWLENAVNRTKLFAFFFFVKLGYIRNRIPFSV